jgi:antitoxin component of MazEF toxin-antitoxin module
MSIEVRQLDQTASLTLPSDFAGCLVQLERHGDELRVSKVGKKSKPRYSFKQLMAKVTDDNIHEEVDTGPAVGEEAL